MTIPEAYCNWCAAADYCEKKPNALPNLPGIAWPECFVDPLLAVKPKPVLDGDQYEMMF